MFNDFNEMKHLLEGVIVKPMGICESDQKGHLRPAASLVGRIFSLFLGLSGFFFRTTLPPSTTTNTTHTVTLTKSYYNDSNMHSKTSSDMLLEGSNNNKRRSLRRNKSSSSSISDRVKFPEDALRGTSRIQPKPVWALAGQSVGRAFSRIALRKRSSLSSDGDDDSSDDESLAEGLF